MSSLCSSVFYVPMFQKRANLSYLRAKVPNDVPIFQLCLPKGRPIFQLFFKIIFQFLNFLIMLTIWKSREYLGNTRKFISKNKKFEFWLLQNFFKEKPYQSKTFDVVFNGVHGISLIIIRLVKNGAEYTFSFT